MRRSARRWMNNARSSLSSSSGCSIRWRRSAFQSRSLRAAIDWAIWPITFRNRKLSNQVERARHALIARRRAHYLSSDPVRSSEPKNAEQIKEVWFAGVHSDVGGGYPDGTLSYVPLVWMAEQVEHKLRFQPGEIEHFRAYQSADRPEPRLAQRRGRSSTATARARSARAKKMAARRSWTSASSSACCTAATITRRSCFRPAQKYCWRTARSGG